MDELHNAIQALLEGSPARITVSAPRPGTGYRRAIFTPSAGGWQLERRTDTQAFHRNLAAEELPSLLAELLTKEFTQAQSLGLTADASLRITKKGKVLQKRGAPTGKQPTGEGHDRKKASLLPEGSVIPPLVDMGVFTADGRVARNMWDKYRQINRFVELVEETLRGKTPERLSIIDFGCGKSYLTILYHYLSAKGIALDMVGLDLKQEVVLGCNEAARRYGYTGLRFEVGDIAEFRRAEPVDMVVTLHACDTATDHALANAVNWGAKYILSVPCCQHELNAQMQSDALSLLTRYGLVKERSAALMTDAVRAGLLTACGYKTALVEFVELEHTPKNILIRAVKGHGPQAHRLAALEEVNRLCGAFGFDPCLLRLLEERGLLPKT